jgi:hypothetical protein
MQKGGSFRYVLNCRADDRKEKKELVAVQGFEPRTLRI